MKLTREALRRPVAMVVLTAAALVIGSYGLFTLDVDYLPEIVYPMIKIHMWWRGATPEEIENNVAEPVERVMSTVEDVDYLESSSIEGMYTLLVNFQYGTDVEEAYQDVIAAYGRVGREMPRDMLPPVIIKADPSQLPVLQVTISSPDRDLVWLRDWAENWLQDRLITVAGTAGVEIVGGLEREIRVHLDPRRLEAYGISPQQVATALGQSNLETFAGRVTVETREIIARTMGEFESLDEIRDVVVAAAADGAFVRVRDLAAVEDAHEEVRVITDFNGEPCVKLSVLKQADANTVDVSRQVDARLDELRPLVPPDIRFGVVENQGDYVIAGIESVRDAAFLAGVLVVFVVYLGLGRWRQVLVMVISLPVTVLANFYLMRVAGFSINLFSLGGLVVALGVVLDNSIVVVENITRLKDRGDVPDFALRGAEEVARPIVAATVTFLVLFLPFLMVPGLAALLFKELVLVVAGILLVSLLSALTLTPFLASRLLAGDKGGRESWAARLVGGGLDVLTAWYRRVLDRLLDWKGTVVLLILVLFVVSLVLLPRVGSEFLPKLDDGRVMVKVKMPAGTSVATTRAVLEEIYRKIEGLPEIESIFTLAGGKVWGLYTYEIANEGELDIQLAPKSRRSISTAEFVSKISPLAKSVSAPGGRIGVMQMKVKGIRKIGEQEVEVKVKGDSVSQIFGVAQQVAGALRQTPGLANVMVSMDLTKPEYRIFVDRDRASAFGISVEQVATTLQGLVSGTVVTRYHEGAEYYPIRVMVPEVSMTGKEDLENLVVDVRDGRRILLRDVAQIRREVGPVEIVREDQAKQVIVRADSAGISVGEAVDRARAELETLDRPPGVQFEMGGQAQMMRENQRSLALILAFAFFFAYVVLALQFESFIQPFLIMVRVPLTLLGVVAALLVTGIPIGVTVLIGVVVLAGNEVNHGVVLLEFINDLRRQGLGLREAILEGSAVRVRPIVMTLFTSMMGMLPLALNLGEGGDMLVPMAVAVIGGLVFSVVMTLVFLPCAYLLLPGRPLAADEAKL